MDTLVVSEALEKIKLLSKYVGIENSDSRERLTALVWIGELVDQANIGQEQPETSFRPGFNQ